MAKKSKEKDPPGFFDRLFRRKPEQAVQKVTPREAIIEVEKEKPVQPELKKKRKFFSFLREAAAPLEKPKGKEPGLEKEKPAPRKVWLPLPIKGKPLLEKPGEIVVKKPVEERGEIVPKWAFEEEIEKEKPVEEEPAEIEELLGVEKHEEEEREKEEKIAAAIEAAIRRKHAAEMPAARPLPAIERKPAARPKIVIEKKPFAPRKPPVERRPAAIERPFFGRKPAAAIERKPIAVPVEMRALFKPKPRKLRLIVKKIFPRPAIAAPENKAAVPRKAKPARKKKVKARKAGKIKKPVRIKKALGKKRAAVTKAKARRAALKGKRAGLKKKMAAEKKKKIMEIKRQEALRKRIIEREHSMVKVLRGKMRRRRMLKIAEMKKLRRLEKKLKLKPQKIKKPKIKRIAPEKISKIIARERSKIEQMIRRKGPGWFGEKARHRKAALKYREQLKKRKVAALKKKEKKKGLTTHELKKKATLESEITIMRGKIRLLEEKLKEVEKRHAEEKLLEAPVAAPTKELQIAAEAIKDAAHKIAEIAPMPAISYVKPEEARTFDEQIRDTKLLMKRLEFAFYKRRVGYEDFRNKMFQYEQKLWELEQKKKAWDKQQKEGIKPAKGLLAKIVPSAAMPKVLVAKELKTVEDLQKAAAAVRESAEKVSAAAPAPKIKSVAPEEAARLESDMHGVQDSIKRLESDFYKKRVGYEQFMEKMFDLEQRLRIAEEKGKVVARKKARAVEKPAPALAEAKPTEAAPAAAEEKPAEVPKPVEEIPEIKPRVERLEEELEAIKARREAAEARPTAVPKAPAEELEEIAVPAKPAGAVKKPPVRIPKVKVRRIKAKAPKARPAAKVEEEARPIKIVIEERPAAVPAAIERVIAQKAAGRLSDEQMQELERRVSDVIQRYKVPEREIERGLRSMESERLVSDFDKLINLIELEHETKMAMRLSEEEAAERRELYEPATALAKQKKEKVEAVEKEIKRFRIETDFDRILNYAKEKGEVKVMDLAMDLGMNRKRLQECLEILEDNHLILIEYPPVGGAKIVDLKYARKRLEERKKKKPGEKEAVEKPGAPARAEARPREKAGLFSFMSPVRQKPGKPKEAGKEAAQRIEITKAKAEAAAPAEKPAAGAAEKPKGAKGFWEFGKRKVKEGEK